MEEIAPVWYILTGDRIRLDGKEFEVLDKNLAPPLFFCNEVGFCLRFRLCIKEENSPEHSWQFFYWDDEVTRIYS